MHDKNLIVVGLFPHDGKVFTPAFLKKVENTYGKAQRVWVMDRGIPSEAQLKDMRAPERQTFYLVGTPKGKINQHEKKWLDLPWQKVRDSVEVKLYEHEGELYVLAKSQGRQAKEIAIRRKRLARLLRKLRAMRKRLPKRDQLLLRIGAARKEAGRAFGFVKIRLPQKDEPVTRDTFLSGGQGQAESRPTTRWALSVAQQSHQRRSSRVVDALYPTDSDRIRFPFSEKRVGNPAHLSSAGASGRRSHSDCLSCLLPASHAEKPSDDSCARFDPSGRVRKARDHSDGGGLDSDAGWPLAGVAAPYPAGKRRSGGSGPAPNHAALPATASH